MVNKEELKICSAENLPSRMIYEIDIDMQNKALEPILFLAPLNTEVLFFHLRIGHLSPKLHARE